MFEAEASLTRLSDQATHKAPSSPCSTLVRHPPFTGLAAHQRARGNASYCSWVSTIYVCLPKVLGHMLIRS